MAGTDCIDKVVISTDAASPEERADLWADAVRPLFDASILGADAATHALGGSAWLLDNVFITRAAFGEQIVHRHASHIAAENQATVMIEFYLQGSLTGEIDGTPLAMETGDIQLVDFTREYSAKSSPAQVRGLVVSHQALGYDPNIHAPALRIPGDSVTARVLRNTILGIHAELDSVTKVDAPQVATGLVGLLRNVFLEKADLAQSAPHFAVARRRAIREFIRQNIQTGELSADDICAQFNVSRATLYREFKDNGGVQRYILDQKLELALLMLASSPKMRGTVVRVSDLFQFPSLSYFSHAFKRRYGFGPSEIVGHSQALRKRSTFQNETQPSDLAQLLQRL
ncbi:MAG: AraC family transcriptional regulator [Pseudomonadota bacterium]